MTRRGCTWLVAVVLLSACASIPDVSGREGVTVIAGIPDFAEQLRRDDCAGVALSSLLAHAGLTVSPAEIDTAVYDPRLGGALLPDLERFSAKAGATPRSGRGSMAEVRSLLASGRPLLVPLDMGWGPWRRPHYVVVYGFGPETFLMHLRHDETLNMPAAEFDRRWAGMGRLYLYLEQ